MIVIILIEWAIFYCGKCLLIHQLCILNLNQKIIDLFFNSLMSIKQDTWRMIDINSMLSTILNKIVNDNTINMV